MPFRLARRTIPVTGRRFRRRRLLPWLAKMALVLVLLAGVVMAAQWGLQWQQRMGADAEAQQELVQLRAEMLALQRQLQSQVPSLAQADPPESASAYSLARPSGSAHNPLRLADQATIARLLEQLRELEVENQRLRDSLGFYETLLPLGDNGGGVAIRNLAVSRADADQLSWQLLVMHARRDAAPFEGRLTWQVQGELDGQAWTLPADEQALSFTRYQRLEGLLPVPEGVRLQSVTAIVMEGAQERARQTVVLEPE